LAIIGAVETVHKCHGDQTWRGGAVCSLSRNGFSTCLCCNWKHFYIFCELSTSLVFVVSCWISLLIEYFSSCKYVSTCWHDIYHSIATPNVFRDPMSSNSTGIRTSRKAGALSPIAIICISARTGVCGLACASILTTASSRANTGIGISTFAITSPVLACTSTGSSTGTNP
jgi:hypothetical protein